MTVVKSLNGMSEPISRANAILFLREFSHIPEDWFPDLRDETLRLCVKDIEKKFGVGWRVALGHPAQELISDKMLEFS